MGATGLPLIYSAVLLALCVSYIQGTYSFVIPVHTFISFDIESSNRNNFGKKNVNGNRFWHFGSNQNVQSKNNFDEFLTGSHSPSRPTQRWTEGNKKNIRPTALQWGKKRDEWVPHSIRETENSTAINGQTTVNYFYSFGRNWQTIMREMAISHVDCNKEYRNCYFFALTTRHCLILTFSFYFNNFN